jgi:hypothetical protein
MVRKGQGIQILLYIFKFKPMYQTISGDIPTDQKQVRLNIKNLLPGRLPIFVPGRRITKRAGRTDMDIRDVYK